MCDPASIAVAATVASGGLQAYSQYQQGVATSKAYKYAAAQSRAEGEALLKRGEKQSELIQDSAKVEGKKQKILSAETLSEQKAALAARGIDLSSVSAADLASSSIDNAKLDEIALRYNADINAWNTMEEAKFNKWKAFEEASSSDLAAKNAKKAGLLNAFSTLAGTAASVASIGLFTGGKAAVAGKGGYGLNTPSGTRNMGTWSRIA